MSWDAVHELRKRQVRPADMRLDPAELQPWEGDPSTLTAAQRRLFEYDLWRRRSPRCDPDEAWLHVYCRACSRPDDDYPVLMRGPVLAVLRLSDPPRLCKPARLVQQDGSGRRLRSYLPGDPLTSRVRQAVSLRCQACGMRFGAISAYGLTRRLRGEGPPLAMPS